jgi:hypothetical protein
MPDTLENSILDHLRKEILSTGRYKVILTAIDSALLATDFRQVLPPLGPDAVSRLVHGDTNALLIVLEAQDPTPGNGLAFIHYSWRIYDNGMRTLFDQFGQTEKLNTIGQAGREHFVYGGAAATAAKRYAHHILMHWEWIWRDYFSTGSDRMKDASAAVQADDWATAAAAWTSVAADTLSSAGRMLAGQACYNLAIYYELHDQLDKALEYAHAAKRHQVKEAAEYIETLLVRIGEAKLVSAQAQEKQGMIPVPEER